MTKHSNKFVLNSLYCCYNCFTININRKKYVILKYNPFCFFRKGNIIRWCRAVLVGGGLSSVVGVAGNAVLDVARADPARRPGSCKADIKSTCMAWLGIALGRVSLWKQVVNSCESGMWACMLAALSCKVMATFLSWFHFTAQKWRLWESESLKVKQLISGKERPQILSDSKTWCSSIMIHSCPNIASDRKETQVTFEQRELQLHGLT